MEREFRKFNSFKEQEESEITEYVCLTVDQRLAISRQLRKRVYGKCTPDVREFHKKK